MKVQMLKDCLSTIDGFKIQKFHAGEVYDLREFIATNLISSDLAEYVSGKLQKEDNFLNKE